MEETVEAQAVRSDGRPKNKNWAFILLTLKEPT